MIETFSDLAKLLDDVHWKGGLRVLNDTVRAGVAAARVAAIGTNKLPVCVVVDRSGTRIQRYAVVPLEEFADYHGCTGGTDD